ncbi:hypothetical protein O6H91_20G017800 [Diphasiastrum complanatum]|nr:hypothetical protein O6H91_20G017800 [Diphasiastrum complanatum]
MIHAKLSIAVYHTFYEIQLLFKAQEITTEKEQQLNEETLRKVLELAYDFCEKLLRLKQIPELECTMQIIQGILGNAEFVGSSKQGQVFILMQSLIKDILQEIESQMEGLSTSIAIDTMPIENSKSEDSVKSEVFTSSGADEDIAEPDLPKDAPAISTAIPQSHKSIGSLSGMAFESARNSCSTADLKLDSSSISLDQTVSVELASHGGHSGHVNEQLFSILAVPNQKFQVNKSARFSKKKSPDAQDSKDFCFSIKPVMHILDVKHEELHLLELHNISDRGRSRKIFELTEGLDKASISVLQNSSSKTEATCDMKKENIAENNASINNSDIHHHMDIELCKDDRSAKSFETRKDSHLFKDGLKESSDTPLDNDAQRLEASLEKRALPIDSHLKVKRASSDSKKTPLPSLEHNYINQGGALLNNRAAPFLEQIPSSMSQSGMRSDVQKLCLSSNFLLSVDLADFDSHSCTSFSCTEVDDAKSSTRVEYSYNQRLSDEESSDSQQRGDCYKTSTADLPLEDPYKNKKLFWKQDFQRRSLEQDRMLHAGKLCLVLDLDHTLLNSAKFSEIEPEWKHKLCAIQSKYRSRHGNGVRKRELHCCTNLGMWTKLRPGIWRFLAKASELYELHLYTMGNKVYATQMAKLLDPTGELFAGRIISKGDDGNDKQAKSKNLNGVPGMESAVLIVDDSARVWPFHRKNLIGVERYMYFPCTRRQFGLPGPSLLEAGRDEREVDGMLLSTLAVLTKIHKAFFERCPLGERPDVRGLLAAEQQRILQGCGIVFSRVFPLGESQPQLHPLWQLAEQFGAKCSTSTDNSTTHIVAVSLGTDKIRWARANGRYVVNPQWLEASAVLYRRANEKHFPVTAHPRASAVLYRRSNEQQFPGTSPDRIDQRASSTTI